MSGTVGPRISPFINTYSLDFDGVDDYVGLGNSTDLQITGAFSFSCWVNTTSTNYEGIYFKGNSVALSDIYIRRQNNGTVRFFINNVSKNVTSSTTVNDGNWHHIMCVYVPSTSMTIYIDGSQDAQNTTTIPAAINNNYGNITIGEGGGQYFDGNIDEVSIFNTDQSTNIATLSTAPTIDLTSLNPIAWYRMGDNGAYKDPQWLIPSNENKAKVSNYSMAFDGTGNFVDLGDSDDFSFGNGTTDSPFSISAWIKIDSTSNFRIFNKYASSINEYQFGTGGANILQFYIFDSTSTFKYRARVYNTILNTGQWYHVAATYSGVGGTNAQDGMKIYVDGIRVDDSTVSGGSYVAMGNKTTPVYIGKLDASYANGLIDEVSVYASELSQSDVTNIYNGGTPTTISGALSHYKMGENATYTTVWNIPDEVGINDGTSVNMTIEDRVGTAPSSSNNALSFNMDLIDRVEDTPQI